MHRPAASDDVKQLGEVLLDINARHERLINGLLLLARTEHGITDRSYVDLSDVTDHVVGETSAEGLTATVSTAEAPVLGDALLLERLVRNLVDNAIRHNVAGGWLHVATDTVADRARLVVTNTGPAVPRYEIPALFEPFRRAGAERVGSTGLGLSIVRAIVRAHGGLVTAEPREGGGLVVTVLLPLALTEAPLVRR
jgi:signal transduction histidine kinase